jgi:hypothetical protein
MRQHQMPPHYPALIFLFPVKFWSYIPSCSSFSSSSVILLAPQSTSPSLIVLVRCTFIIPRTGAYPLSIIWRYPLPSSAHNRLRSANGLRWVHRGLYCAVHYDPPALACKLLTVAMRVDRGHIPLRYRNFASMQIRKFIFAVRTNSRPKLLRTPGMLHN